MADWKDEFAELMPEDSTIYRQGVGIDVKRLIKLRAHIMILVFLLVAVPAIPLIWLLVPAYYISSADIEFSASTLQIMGGPERSLSGTPAYESYVNTQIELITGYPILSQVVEDPDVQNLPTIRGAGDALQYVYNNIEADNSYRTELVTFIYRDMTVDASKTVLQTVIDKYLEYIRDRELEQGNTRRTALRAKETELETQLQNQLDAITEMRKQLEVPVGNTPGVEPTETESYRVNLAQAQSDTTTAQGAIREAEKLIERVEGFMARYQSNPTEPIFELGIEERVNQDPAVQLSIEQMAQTEQEFSYLQETYVESAPQLKVKRSELEGLQNKLASSKASARREAIQSLLANYEYELEVAQADLQDAEARSEKFMSLLEDYRQENLALAYGLAEIQEMERRYEDLRENKANITDQLLNIDIESNAPARANVVGQATTATSPDHSERMKWSLVALMAAVMLGVASALVVEFLDQSIRSPEDIAGITKVPSLSAIPWVTEDRLPPNTNLATVTDDYPNSYTSDEIRRVVARILYAGRRGGETKTVVIASPSKDDGKTTLACNVGLVLAQADRRVLLVDLDSRNPEVERSLGLMPSAGLVELLSGEPLEHNAQRTVRDENLHVMGPGLRSGNLVEYLASREMNDFLAGAEELFDHIIIDTPPALLTSEAKLLAPLADGILVVAGAGVSTFGMLRRCLNSLEQAGGNLIGVVVNRMRHKPGGYMRRNLTAFYEQDQGHQRSSTVIPKPRRGDEPSIVLVNDRDEH
jgi:capsular exopolysaccharide synthesis family protein